MKLNIDIKRLRTETFYKIIRVPAVPFVKAKFHPIILNQDVIPKNGNIIFAPNHRETYDAFLMLVAIKSPVHWMALKRFFTGEDSIFNNSKNPFLCQLTSLVFKGIGAVPIIRDMDRDKYPNLNNDESLELFSHYLRNGGNAGIFPEGSTNKNPESRNIGEVKKSVFHLAKEHDTWIQPISLVWAPKKSSVANKSIINFREPYKVGNTSISDAVDYWIEKVDSGIEENKKIIYNLEEISSIVSPIEKEKRISLILK